MDHSIYTLQTLFSQLGVGDDPEAVDAFIALHKPLSSDVILSEAPFWNESQAAFLAEAIAQDSDWCVIVDKLDTLLREKY
jgi:Protein of unknown function (DUF2789)